MELPPAALLFRSARQYVYGVLFSLAETQRKMERLAVQRQLPVEGTYTSGIERALRVPCTAKMSMQVHYTFSYRAV